MCLAICVQNIFLLWLTRSCWITFQIMGCGCRFWLKWTWKNWDENDKDRINNLSCVMYIMHFCFFLMALYEFRYEFAGSLRRIDHINIWCLCSYSHHPFKIKTYTLNIESCSLLRFNLPPASGHRSVFEISRSYSSRTHIFISSCDDIWSKIRLRHLQHE